MGAHSVDIDTSIGAGRIFCCYTLKPDEVILGMHHANSTINPCKFWQKIHFFYSSLATSRKFTLTIALDKMIND